MVQNQRRKSIDISIKDEYDDLMISNIELTTDDESDDNYSLMFVRKKKESFLTLNSRAQQEISQVTLFPFSFPPSTKTPKNTLINMCLENVITPSTDSGTSKKACLDGVSVISFSEKYTSIYSASYP